MRSFFFITIREAKKNAPLLMNMVNRFGGNEG